MKIHRFIGQFNLNNDIVEISDVDLVNQIRNVFRFSEGDKLMLCDGANHEALSEILVVDKKRVEVRILERNENKNNPKNHSTLYCSILKKENFELVVQKAVECGIEEITPVITERTVKFNLNIERLEKIAREAAEQSGRGVVPKINQPVKFENAIEAVIDNSLGLFFDESGDDSALDILRSNKLPNVNAWIGPEGGWSDAEISLAIKNGLKVATLGRLTLRGETAAITASYLISNV